MINVTAASISTGGAFVAIIGNTSGANIGGSANLAFNLSGQLATQSDTSFTITNSNGGMIGADAAMNVSAANISTGGILNALIDNSGGTIGGSANLAFNLSGQLATQSDTSFTINNSNGGMIGVDAGMNVSATNISTVGSLFANILNFASGNIVGGADLSLNLTGDLTTQGDALLTISNDTGGMIGSDAVINVTAANISTGGALNAAIINSSGGSGGNIVGSANINFNLTGDLTTAGDATLVILNDPGTIGSDAVINVTAKNVSTGTLNAAIDNSSGGNIGGIANLSFTLASDLTTVGDANFLILNFDDGSGSGLGTIGSNATVSVTANNISTQQPLMPGSSTAAWHDRWDGHPLFRLGGDLTTTSGVASFRIDNANRNGIGGSSINGDAIINIGVGGDISAQGTGVFEIANDDGGSGNGGGTIGSGAIINVSAANISTGGPLIAAILNALSDFNFSGGTIGGNATINVTAANITANSWLAQIDNSNGGSIGSGASVTLNIGGNFTRLKATRPFES